MVLFCVCVAGCNTGVDEFTPADLYAKRMEMESGADVDPIAADIEDALTELFGTPDEPKWPGLDEFPELANVVSLENLKRASGPISSDENDTHFGLYRKHCILCHGVSGNGRGPTAKLLNPYPRDFRLGKFKFKSTPIGSKPTRGDFREILHRGIPGTSMASFSLVKDEDIEALIDYTIYLSVRGQTERALLTEASLNLDYEAGDRIYDASLESSDSEAWGEQLNFVSATARRFIRQWAEADEVLIASDPKGFVVASGVEQFEGEVSEDLAQSVKNGESLYQGKVANCYQCHGTLALGDGQLTDYDDWTKDWTVFAGLNPADREEIDPMLELGALKPRTIPPRNLRSGVYRGGARPEDLYRRLVNGIEGTPMPALPLKPENPQGLSEQEVWDIVNYLLSLPSSPLSGNLAAEPEANSSLVEAGL